MIINKSTLSSFGFIVKIYLGLAVVKFLCLSHEYTFSFHLCRKKIKRISWVNRMKYSLLSDKNLKSQSMKNPKPTFFRILFAVACNVDSLFIETNQTSIHGDPIFTINFTRAFRLANTWLNDNNNFFWDAIYFDSFRKR